MASRKKKEEAGDSGFSLGSVPFSGVFKVFETLGDVFYTYIKGKYRVEERIGELKDGAEKKIEELRRETIRTAYELKKAFFRTIVEAILLSTGILAFVAGIILLVRRFVPLDYVLIGYGLLVMVIVLLQLRLSPEYKS